MNIHEALQAQRPAIAAQAIRLVDSQFEHLQQDFGPSMKGVANSASYSIWNRLVRGLCDRSKEGVYTLNAGRVAAHAEEQAAAMVEAWEVKMLQKMGEVEGAQVAHIAGFSYRVEGTRQGKAVRIEQSMILNVSSKGMLFNQFPARIYVDNKFMSAAKYAALFA